MSAPPDPAAIADGYARARRALADGRNMVETLLAETALPRARCVEIAYALQAGDYTRAMGAAPAAAYRAEAQGEIASLLRRFNCESVLDCGVGEATAWVGFDRFVKRFCGLDLSLARLGWAARNLAEAPFEAVVLVKADMAALPVAPGAFDAVVTMHALEPNGDAAPAMLERLAACAGELLILLEPNYRDAGPEMRARMERHGYATGIWDAAEALPGFEVAASKPLTHATNPLNATSLIALKRTGERARPDFPFVNPVTGGPLKAGEDGLRDADGAFAWPAVGGVLCLAPEDGVFLGRPPGAG